MIRLGPKYRLCFRSFHNPHSAIRNGSLFPARPVSQGPKAVRQPCTQDIGHNPKPGRKNAKAATGLKIPKCIRGNIGCQENMACVPAPPRRIKKRQDRKGPSGEDKKFQHQHTQLRQRDYRHCGACVRAGAAHKVAVVDGGQHGEQAHILQRLFPGGRQGRQLFIKTREDRFRRFAGSVEI